MKLLKDLKNTYIFSFIFSFMFCIYEPLNIYVTNTNNVVFDIYVLSKPILISFSLMLITLVTFFTLLYLFCEKLINNIFIYKIVFYIIFFLFIALAIQGNFLIYDLPELDGADIYWNKYVFQNIISIVTWIFVIIVAVILGKKIGVDKVLDKISTINVYIFFVLFITLIGQFFIVNGIFDKKEWALSTKDNYQLASKNNNFYVLLLDSIDSVEFDNIMKDKKYEDVFNDFTYYKDTTSTYIYTRDSVPYILTGKWNKNKEEFKNYCSNSLDNSYLLNKLREKNYNISLFTNAITWESDKYKDINNLIKYDRKINSFNYLKEQKKFILYKYLPFFLKRFSNIESLNYDNGILLLDKELFDWNLVDAYSDYKNNDLKLTDENVFKFIHLEGGHLPFDVNNKVEHVGFGEGSYDYKLESSILVIKEFLEQLKRNNVYDNSSIIIMSDHGYSLEGDIKGRVNPILFIKGVDEHHDLERSDLPISYTDLESVYTDLLDNKKTDELFNNIDVNRERKVILYELYGENHMIEYVQKGKAWDEKTLKPTGKEYNK